MKREINNVITAAGGENRRPVKAILILLCLMVCFVSQAVAQSSYSLAQYQTPFRFTDGIYGDPNETGQGNRGTCWAFAGVAALEAAYKRKYGLELDLSEQYTFHMGKVLAYGSGVPDSNSSLVGFQGSSDIIHHLSRFAVPEERFAPYLSGARMEQLRVKLNVGEVVNFNLTTQMGYDTFELSQEHIPTAARWNAKYQVTDYAQVSHPNNTDELEEILRQNHEIVADIKLRRKVDATTSVWDFDPTVDPDKAQFHVMLIIGYDRDRQVFLVKNSWGETDFVRLTYSLVSNCIGGGYYIKDVADPNQPPQKKARYLGFWNFEDSSLKGTLVIRRFTDLRADDPNAQTKLGTLYANDGQHDVRGYFIDDGDGVVLNVTLDHPEIPMRVEYLTGFWAFVDRNYTGEVEKGTDWQPVRSFVVGANIVPRYGTVFVQPGSYAAVGTYDKPMTIKAPHGGVTLRD